MGGGRKRAQGSTVVRAQAISWAGVAALSVLIVASRKHYTVDVLIAWYVVPLVFHTLARRWTTRRHAGDGALSPADAAAHAVDDIETGCGPLQVGVGVRALLPHYL